MAPDHNVIGGAGVEGDHPATSTELPSGTVAAKDGSPIAWTLDADGKLAALGKADEAWIARALELPFFAAPPPKSLDRNDFATLKLGDVLPALGRPAVKNAIGALATGHRHAVGPRIAVVRHTVA